MLGYLWDYARRANALSPGIVGAEMAIARADLFHGFACHIQLIKSQRGRGHVQLAVEIIRAKTGNLSAPGDRLD